MTLKRVNEDIDNRKTGKPTEKTENYKKRAL